MRSPAAISRPRLGVLVSGHGSNLEAIIAATDSGSLDAAVVAVVSNKPGCRALSVARQAGVPQVAGFTLREYGDLAMRDAAMAQVLREARVDLVVAAGYDRVLDPAFVSAFAGRLVNVHPSLLPAFAGGMEAIQQAYDAGEKQTGVTIHLIEPGPVDAGSILAQEAVDIVAGETVDQLKERIRGVEHRLLPQVIQAWLKRSPVG